MILLLGGKCEDHPKRAEEQKLRRNYFQYAYIVCSSCWVLVRVSIKFIVVVVRLLLEFANLCGWFTILMSHVD